jgi:hypothetical protein
MTHRKHLHRAGLALFFLPLVLLLSVRPFDERLGLTGTYYSRADWSGARFSRIDYQISTDALGSAVKYAANRPFAVSWRGLLAIDRPGSYRFEIVSDDGSAVRIDDRTIIDINGPHGPLAGRGQIQLDRGLHPFEIDFFEAGGGWKIELFWAREGDALTRIPATAFLHEPIGMAPYSLLRAASGLAAFVPICWMAGGLLLVIGWLSRTVWFGRAIAELRWPPLLGVLAASVLLNALGLWWGFPDGWAPDEIGPGDVLGGLDQLFSSGWYSRYPPFQFYLLGMFSAPFVLADLLRPSDPNAQGVYAMLFIVNRLVSVTMAAGTILVCYFCARRLARDRMAGLFAAAAMSVVLPFIYYSKVANLDVPYLFWFALAMFAYIRILQDAPPSAYRLFALTGMLAICTKDQAYGFFVLPGLHVIVRRYQQVASGGPNPVRRLMTDRVLLSAAAIAVAAFVVFDNLLFNFSGFVEHVRVITGGASTGYQMVPGTVGGRFQLLSDIFGLIRWSFGWPLFLLAGAALAATAVKRDKALWLLLPALSYYLLFLNVVLYAYDRFLLGLCLILAIIMGCRLSEWLARRDAPGRMAMAVAILGFVYAAVNAASLDAMMIGDSRYGVQRWFRANVPHDALIALIGRREYLPVLDGFVARYLEPPQLDGVRDNQFVIVNAKYMRRFGPGSDAYELHQQMRRGDGYSLVLRRGPSLPWLPLARDPVFQSQDEDPFTNLTKVDPQIEVYRRK